MSDTSGNSWNQFNFNIEADSEKNLRKYFPIVFGLGSWRIEPLEITTVFDAMYQVNEWRLR